MKHLYLSIVLISTLLYSCTQQSPLERSLDKKPQIVLQENFFKIHNQKELLRLNDYDFEEQKFTPLDSTQKQQLFNELDFIKDSLRSYEGYFVALQPKVNNIRPFIVDIYGENYDALILFNINEDNKIVSYKEIAGGFCAGPQKFKDYIQWCDDKDVFFVNDSTFRVNNYHFQSPSYERASEKAIDSVTTTYKIRPSGEFEMIKKDSIRYHWVGNKRAV